MAFWSFLKRIQRLLFAAILQEGRWCPSSILWLLFHVFILPWGCNQWWTLLAAQMKNAHIQWGIVTFLDEESSPSRIYYPPSLITQRYEWGRVIDAAWTKILRQEKCRWPIAVMARPGRPIVGQSRLVTDPKWTMGHRKWRFLESSSCSSIPGSPGSPVLGLSFARVSHRRSSQYFVLRPLGIWNPLG